MTQFPNLAFNGAVRTMDSPSIIIAEFARVLAGTNPRFDRERFLRACGVKGP